MPDLIEILIPVDAGAAPALADARTRAAMGRLISRALRPTEGPGELEQAIAAAKQEARAAGLTDAEVDAELDAYNDERRGRSAG